MNEEDGNNRPRSFRERHYTSQDGLKLYFREYGDPYGPATPLLCLGGLTRNSKDFHALAKRHAAERRVICPDYRGRGRSAYDPDWRNYHPRTYLEDIRHLLAVCGIHKVTVIGTSLGGILAAALSVTMPSALAGVVLNDVGPDVDSSGLGRIITYMMDDTPLPNWDSAVATLKRIFPGVAAPDERTWRSIAEATYRLDENGKLRFDWDVDIVKPLVRTQEIEDLWPLFKALRPIPVLAIRGETSDILSIDTFARMNDALPQMVPLTVPGVGHVPSLNEQISIDAIHELLGRT